MIKLIKRFLNWIKGFFSSEEKPPVEAKPVAKRPIVRHAKIKLGSDIISAEIVTENFRTIWVRLADNHIIKRHKEKHVVIA